VIGHTLERTEKVDVNVLNALLRHEGIDNETKATLKKIHRRLRNGKTA